MRNVIVAAVMACALVGAPVLAAQPEGTAAPAKPAKATPKKRHRHAAAHPAHRAPKPAPAADTGTK